MHVKTMEGLSGAHTNYNLLKVPFRVYKDARRRGDLGVMERAMGYVSDFAGKSQEYQAEAAFYEEPETEPYGELQAEPEAALYRGMQAEPAFYEEPAAAEEPYEEEQPYIEPAPVVPIRKTVKPTAVRKGKPAAYVEPEPAVPEPVVEEELAEEEAKTGVSS